MSVVSPKRLPPPKSEQAFEELCLDIWRRKLRDPHAQLYGHRGQTQYGIDIIGRRAGSVSWVGIQCKARSSGVLRIDEVQDDLAAACRSNPQLTEFVIATTARRDTRLQDFARVQTTINSARGLFSVETFFWDDVESSLHDEGNLDLLRQYYGEYVVHALPSGVALAKMFSLRLGVEEVTTRYELVIGKTAQGLTRESHQLGLSYFKDLAFLVNLQARRAAVFRMPVRHYSDLETAIGNRTDEYAIAKWLNSHSSLDEVLRTSDEQHTILISFEEWDTLNPPRQSED